MTRHMSRMLDTLLAIKTRTLAWTIVVIHVLFWVIACGVTFFMILPSDILEMAYGSVFLIGLFPSIIFLFFGKGIYFDSVAILISSFVLYYGLFALLLITHKKKYKEPVAWLFGVLSIWGLANVVIGLIFVLQFLI